LTVLIFSISSFIISYSFDGYRGLGLHPFFYNFALLCLELWDYNHITSPRIGHECDVGNRSSITERNDSPLLKKKSNCINTIFSVLLTPRGYNTN